MAHVADAVIDAYASRRSGGVYVMQGITASSCVRKNLDHALAPFIYTISTMHCMRMSLASSGMGLGVAWGREHAEEDAAARPDAAMSRSIAWSLTS